MSRSPVAAAILLVLIGVLATAAALDAPSDGSLLRLGWSTWRTDGVAVEVVTPGSQLMPGDVVTTIEGDRLADGLGGVPAPGDGQWLRYGVDRAQVPEPLLVRAVRPDVWSLLDEAWGNIVFVVALFALGIALRVRRPEEPATAPLLVLGAGLFGSTIAVVAGLPALALAVAGPRLWLFHLSAIGVYSIAWGALLAFSLTFISRHPWLRAGRRALLAAYTGPLLVMLVWTPVAALLAQTEIRWLGLVHTGQTAVAALALLLSIVAGVAGYRADRDPLTRSRLRWMAGGGAVAALLGIAGWHLPELLTGRQPLPWGALGLSGLPFVLGIAVALRRHRLFDIERLANRSLVYAATIAVLVAGYAVGVALLVSGLRLSQTVAAALAAAGAALALAPLRSAAQSAVNRVMYGDRQEPGKALDRLGTRLGAVMLPSEVLPTVVATVARSLRVPYAAIELADGAGGRQLAAVHGEPVGAVHTEPLLYQGVEVGLLLVSARGVDDPLDPADLRLIGTLAQQVGTAVQAVRLHEDLIRSRAEVVGLREEERRRLRRDLHDGLGPSLAAIGLKAGLAAREVPAGTPASMMLGEISAEATASLADVRRLVEALRPPALDELGLVGAVRSRAASLSGPMEIEVGGRPEAMTLPAAVETAAYRIAVEAITNAVRHSGGRICTVDLRQDDGRLTVTVRDDGGGLDPRRAAGVGLRSMRERAAEVGGEWSVHSNPAGTEVRAVLPTTWESP